MRVTKAIVEFMAAKEIEYHLGRITELEEINEDFEKNMLENFGRESTAREMKWFREALEAPYYRAHSRLAKIAKLVRAKHRI